SGGAAPGSGADDRFPAAARGRRMGPGAGLRRGLVSAGGVGLGALPQRALGLGVALGVDLGRRCTVGVRALPLRPLGPVWRPLGLVARRGAGSLLRPAGVCAG